jgi:hypothetical protein
MEQVQTFLGHVHSERTILVAGASNKIEKEEIEEIHGKISESIESFTETHSANLEARRELVAQRQEELKAREE